MAHTVRELKDVLAFVPDDTEVHLEGCDCINPWDGDLRKLEDGSALLTVTL